MSRSVGGRFGSDLALQWLWCRLAATAPIRLLAWELPYDSGAALKRPKKKKKRKKEKEAPAALGDLKSPGDQPE